MAVSKYGTGTLRKRGNIWYVSYWVDGRQYQKSSKSEDIQKARQLRDQILGRKARGEVGQAGADRVCCNELLDDLLDHAVANIKPSTEKIWRLVIEANIRPFFGKVKAATLTTERMKQYRRKRLAEGRSESTCNRELSILRTAFNLGRKCSPPKVYIVPFFPMVQERVVRQGFLSDEQYAALRDALPEYLKALFVTAYYTGIRSGELLAVKVSQVDLEAYHIVLHADETKSGHARAVPIIGGDMNNYLTAAVANAKQHGEDSPVFLYRGKPFRDFRESWGIACEKAGVPELKFHDLRRTAVRNMRKAGIPQVVRMKISGHRTDSMERRYNIVDTDDLDNARVLLEKRRESKD